MSATMVTLVLSLFLSALLYAHGEQTSNDTNYNETISLLSLWSAEEQSIGDDGYEKYLKYQSDVRVEDNKIQSCKEDADCEKPKECLAFFKVCYRSCKLDSDCESHMICAGNTFCFFKYCSQNSDCRNSVCSEGTCLRVCDCGANGTCSFVNGKKVCNCAAGFGEKNGKCTETCNSVSDCANGRKCEYKGRHKFCSCKSGFFGDTCKIPFDCTPNGKYKDCKKRGRECYYDGNKAVCECPLNQKLHDKENTCKICDCGPNGVCSFVNGEKKCDCKSGFFEKNGTCTDCICRGGRCVIEGGKEICKCSPGFGNFTKTSCKACDCGQDVGCMWEEGFPGRKVCHCKPGYNMKKEKCVWCDCGPDSGCEWISEGWLEVERKVCHCKPGFYDEDGKCVDPKATSSKPTTKSSILTSSLPSTFQDCICRGGSCVLEGEKEVCKCPPGFGNLTEKSCRACDCGADTDCIWESGFLGRKICLCNPGYSMIKGKCVACDCGEDSGCEWKSDGWFQPERKVCHCKSGFYESNGKCVECHCGPFSHSCTLDSKSNKLCSCFTGYSQLDNKCAECNCGPYGTCSFHNGRKKCNCKSFATERKGVCVDKEDLGNACKCP